MAERVRNTKRVERDVIAELEEGLHIVTTDLDGCSAEHPDLLYEVCKQHAFAVAKRDAAKLELKRAMGEVYMDLRTRGQQEGEKRLTEGEIAAMQLQDDRIVTLQDELLEIEGKCDRVAALKEAVIARGFALRDLMAAKIAMYYADPGTTKSRRGT